MLLMAEPEVATIHRSIGARRVTPMALPALLHCVHAVRRKPQGVSLEARRKAIPTS